MDDKGKIKVEAEDNAHILMGHSRGIISHVMCGFNYFDPHGHEAKGQQLHSIQIYGDYGNMRLIGYDWGLMVCIWIIGRNRLNFSQTDSEGLCLAGRGYQGG